METGLDGTERHLIDSLTVFPFFNIVYSSDSYATYKTYFWESIILQDIFYSYLISIHSSSSCSFLTSYFTLCSSNLHSFNLPSQVRSTWFSKWVLQLLRLRQESKPWSVKSLQHFFQVLISHSVIQYSFVVCLFCFVLFTLTFFFCYSADAFNLILFHTHHVLPCLPFPSLSCLSNMLHFDPYREERNNAPSNFRSRSRLRGGHLCRQRGGLQLHKIQSYGQVTSLLLS